MDTAPRPLEGPQFGEPLAPRHLAGLSRWDSIPSLAARLRAVHDQMGMERYVATPFADQRAGSARPVAAVSRRRQG